MGRGNDSPVGRGNDPPGFLGCAGLPEVAGTAAVRQSLLHRLSGVRPGLGAAVRLHCVPEHPCHGQSSQPAAGNAASGRPGTPAAAQAPGLRPAARRVAERGHRGSGGRRQVGAARPVPLAGADPRFQRHSQSLGTLLRWRDHQRAIRADCGTLHDAGAHQVRGKKAGAFLE